MTVPTTWTQALARAMPKVVLHDHLDGGLRPTTLVELAAAAGHELPSTDPDELAAHLTRGANRRDLGLYLEGFEHTVAALQTADALARVARESLEDLADDGVVYAELRFAPELNTRRGLSVHEVVEAALAGMAEGPIPSGLIVDGMRTSPVEVVAASAEVAIDLHGQGVVGFDLAGAESFHPAGVHADALDQLTARGVPLTLHAGEAHGPTMIAEAVERFGARRIGHGVTLVQDLADDGRRGPLAERIHRQGIALECCPTSNVHTGAVGALREHPIARFQAAGITTTINTDNRLMSGVTMSSELLAVATTFDFSPTWGLATALNGAIASFADGTTRAQVMDDVLDRAEALGFVVVRGGSLDTGGSAPRRDP